MSTDQPRAVSTLYGISAVATSLGVQPAAVSNWRRRYPDTPPPDFHAAPGPRGITGTPLWSSLDAWRDWHRGRWSPDTCPD